MIPKEEVLDLVCFVKGLSNTFEFFILEKITIFLIHYGKKMVFHKLSEKSIQFSSVVAVASQEFLLGPLKLL